MMSRVVSLVYRLCGHWTQAAKGIGLLRGYPPLGDDLAQNGGAFGLDAAEVVASFDMEQAKARLPASRPLEVVPETPVV